MRELRLPLSWLYQLYQLFKLHKSPVLKFPTITVLLDGKPSLFTTGSMLYDPNEDKDVDAGKVEVQIKQDATDDNNYRLHLGGKRVFQWFKEKWQSLKQTVKEASESDRNPYIR